MEAVSLCVSGWLPTALCPPPPPLPPSSLLEPWFTPGVRISLPAVVSKHLPFSGSAGCCLTCLGALI